MEDSQTLILPKRAAEILGRSERWVHDLADRGDLPVAKEEPYGKSRTRRWFRQSDVEAYAQRKQSEAV